jgi:hypothetical protein
MKNKAIQELVRTFNPTHAEHGPLAGFLPVYCSIYTALDIDFATHDPGWAMQLKLTAERVSAKRMSIRCVVLDPGSMGLANALELQPYASIPSILATVSMNVETR